MRTEKRTNRIVRTIRKGLQIRRSGFSTFTPDHSSSIEVIPSPAPSPTQFTWPEIIEKTKRRRRISPGETPWRGGHALSEPLRIAAVTVDELVRIPVRSWTTTPDTDSNAVSNHSGGSWYWPPRGRFRRTLKPGRLTKPPCRRTRAPPTRPIVYSAHEDEAVTRGGADTTDDWAATSNDVYISPTPWDPRRESHEVLVPRHLQE